MFDEQCHLLKRSHRDHRQYYPQTGWVEHDAEEIYQNMVTAIKDLLGERVSASSAMSSSAIYSLAITNQRETVVVWNRKTGKPIANAVVWQDTRGAELCRQLRADKSVTQMVMEKSGLLIDPNFSASGVKWLLDHVDGARQQADEGNLLMGTIDTWLIWKLTDGKSFCTDTTNAYHALQHSHDGVGRRLAFALPDTSLHVARSPSVRCRLRRDDGGRTFRHAHSYRRCAGRFAWRTCRTDVFRGWFR